MPLPSPSANAPIGIFDSGIGGLSVLRHVRTLLPHEDVLYAADSGFAPYGGRPEKEIVDRTVIVADFLLRRGAKALIVACNTATAAAVAGLRAIHPDLPVVGVEPGLKPAAAISRSHVVGVLATAFTLGSNKFKQLEQQIGDMAHVRFISQACVGLVDQIEKGELDNAPTAELISRYVTPLIEQGADTLVLGCTHYPFVLPLIEACIASITDKPVSIIDTGDAVARQLARVLAQHALLRESGSEGKLEAFTTAGEDALMQAFAGLLKLQPKVTQITL